jgi:hypothetical protein
MGFKPKPVPVNANQPRSSIDQCDGKRRYRLVDDAIIEAVRLEKKEGHKMESYQCPHCNFYHVGRKIYHNWHERNTFNNR